MQFTTAVFALFASVATVFAQDLSGLPDCAVTCFNDNFANSACSSDDTACLCADTTFYDLVQTCVLLSCSDTDAEATLIWSQTECA